MTFFRDFLELILCISLCYLAYLFLEVAASVVSYLLGDTEGEGG